MAGNSLNPRHQQRLVYCIVEIHRKGKRAMSANGKNRVTAGVLAILLGGIGVHKFYLNSAGMGVLYILFSWTFIPAIIGLIEGIIYLTMSDQDFAVKYGGGWIPPQGYYPPQASPPGSPQPSGQKQCPRCGEYVQQAAQVCRFCGNPFTPQSAP